MSPPVRLARADATSAPRFFELELLDNRYPALHGMRVLAIASVVQYHVTLLFTLEERLPIDPRWAAASLRVFFGMDLFFVLSGFLIGSILLRSVEESGSQGVARFYVRRAFRTFPLYYVLLTACALLVPLTPGQTRHLPLEYAYLTDYGDATGAPVQCACAHGPPGSDFAFPWGWSLAIEEKFYLVVPLLFFLLRKLRGDASRLALLLAMWTSALVVRLLIFSSRPGWTVDSLSDAIYYRSHTRYDALVAGVILAYVHRRWRAAIARRLERPGARAALALSALACLWAIVRPDLFGERSVPLVLVFAWGTLTSLMYFACLLLLLHGDGLVQRALSAPMFRRVATLGYGVYLVHMLLCAWPVAAVARWLRYGRGWPMSAVWPVSLALLLLVSLAVAYVLHVLVEKPFLRLRDRLAR